MNKAPFLWILCAAVLLGCIAIAGCSGTEPTAPATAVPTPVVSPTAEPAPTYAVTAPIKVVGEGIYGIRTTLDAKETANDVHVSVLFNATNTLGASGPGTPIYMTFFAYNYDAVPASFNPQTSEDVKAAGIPYKTRRDTIYSMNVKSWGADLPSDSSQGSLDLTKPYNYGVILEKDSPA